MQLWHAFVCCWDCPSLLMLHKRKNAFQQSFIFILALLALNLNWAIATWWETHSNLWDILICFRLQSPVHWPLSFKAHKELRPKTDIMLKTNMRMLVGGRPEAFLAKGEAVHLKSPRMVGGGQYLEEASYALAWSKPFFKHLLMATERSIVLITFKYAKGS